MEPFFAFLSGGFWERLITIVFSIAVIAAVTAYIRFRILPWVFRRRG